MKKIITFALFFALILSLPVFAAGNCRAVIGANLTEEQINEVYGLMGSLKRGDVPELSMTNDIERSYLEGYIPDEQLGTRSISSVLVTLTGEENSVKCTNINWCTESMYLSAMATAGIENVSVQVAAPFEVSGTAALAGIYMAYEDLTGEKLGNEEKTAAVLDLVTTGQLGQELGGSEALTLVTELKLILDETMEMSDEELYEKINDVADEYNIPINDFQREKLKELCRGFEKLDTDALKDKVEGVKDTFEKMGEMKDKALSFWDRLGEIFAAIAEFISKIMEIFS